MSHYTDLLCLRHFSFSQSHISRLIRGRNKLVARMIMTFKIFEDQFNQLTSRIFEPSCYSSFQLWFRRHTENSPIRKFKGIWIKIRTTGHQLVYLRPFSGDWGPDFFQFHLTVRVLDGHASDEEILQSGSRVVHTGGLKGCKKSMWRI